MHVVLAFMVLYFCDVEQSTDQPGADIVILDTFKTRKKKIIEFY